MRIIYQTSPNHYVNVVIGLSGGLVAAVFAGLLFILAHGSQVESKKGRIPYAELKTGFIISSLSIVLKEGITAFLEGLFHHLYVTIIHTIFWGMFTAYTLIFCFALIIWKRRRRSKRQNAR
jgi:hypothetical protein